MRRRELNECPDQGQGESLQELTKSTAAVGVPQEYFLVANRRFVTLTDTRLVSIAERWDALPQALRSKLERLCLQDTNKKP